MGRKFFQRYSRKHFRHRTGNSSYCLIGEISCLLGKIDIFHNLSGKRSKNFLRLSRFVKCSHLFDLLPNSSEISPKIRSIFLKSMKYFHSLQENLCFLRISENFPNTQQENLPIFFTVYLLFKESRLTAVFIQRKCIKNKFFKM